jgi:hypothetical protein
MVYNYTHKKKSTQTAFRGLYSLLLAFTIFRQYESGQEGNETLVLFLTHPVGLSSLILRGSFECLSSWHTPEAVRFKRKNDALLVAPTCLLS